MIELPYTSEQIATLRKAMGAHVELDKTDVGLILQGLHERGITVVFPRPKFTVAKDTQGGWTVWDYNAGRWVARFAGMACRIRRTPVSTRTV